MSLFDLTGRFPTKETATEWIEGIRWPNGDRYCPKCGGKSTRETKNQNVLKSIFRGTDLKAGIRTRFTEEGDNMKLPKIIAWDIAARKGSSPNIVGKTIKLTGNDRRWCGVALFVASFKAIPGAGIRPAVGWRKRTLKPGHQYGQRSSEGETEHLSLCITDWSHGRRDRCPLNPDMAQTLPENAILPDGPAPRQSPPLTTLLR